MLNLAIVQKKDAETIARLNRDVQEKHVKLFPGIFKQFNYTAVLEAVRSLLQKEDYRSFIAYVDEEPVGYAIVFERNYAENSYRTGYTALVIDQMCVISKYRRLGAGSRLFAAIRDFARTRGVDKLELTVWSKNKQAKSFYYKLGFRTLMQYMRIEV